MFGNNGRKFVILLKQLKCKSEQMSLSLLKKWFVAVAILSFFSVTQLLVLSERMKVFWGYVASPFYPLEGNPRLS